MSRPAKHTPEPWRKWGENAITDGQDEIVAETLLRKEDRLLPTNNMRGANANRIVSCVNACKGIPDPETTVPELVAALQAVTLHIDQMRQYYSADVANEVSSDAYQAIENAFATLTKLTPQ